MNIRTTEKDIKHIKDAYKPRLSDAIFPTVITLAPWGNMALDMHDNTFNWELLNGL